MATFWQGNWARSPQKAIRIATDQPIRPTTWKTKPSHSKKEDQDTEAQEKAQEKNWKTPTRSRNIHVKTLQKLVTLALLLNNKSPPRQNPRKKKQPLAEQEKRTKKKHKTTTTQNTA